MVGVNRIEPQPAIKANKEWGGLTKVTLYRKTGAFPNVVGSLPSANAGEWATA